VDVHEILNRPYQRVLIPDAESGTFAAIIAEFPGCISQGDNPAEAYSNLEDAAQAWLESALESGIPIPEPEADREESFFSGRIVLRMPKSMHRDAVKEAEREGTSLNSFLLTAVAAKLGQDSVRNELSALRRELLEAINQPLLFAGMAAHREAPTPAEPVHNWDFQLMGNVGTISVEGLYNKLLHDQSIHGWNGTVPIPERPESSPTGNVRRR
jgi:antitoxin HicB